MILNQWSFWANLVLFWAVSKRAFQSRNFLHGPKRMKRLGFGLGTIHSKKWNLTRQKKEEISTSHHQSLKVNVVHIWYVFTLKLRFHDYRTITKTSFRLTSTVISWFGKPRSGSIPMITLHPHWFHWNSQIGLNDLAQHHKVNICGHSRSARD